MTVVPRLLYAESATPVLGRAPLNDEGPAGWSPGRPFALCNCRRSGCSV